MQYKPIVLGPCPPIARKPHMAQIHNSSMAFALLKAHYNPLREEFWLITLNTCLKEIGTSMISRGTLNFCLVHPRDLFREALVANAYALIIAHNHPSLNLQPTPEDLELTKKLTTIAEIIEIPIIDHIIFSDENYFSFKENNLI